ncbi:hypothetical protein HY212_07635 [Candidatus Pacearchaeota archaeon]|nr:hypothetical protein [Candidatus Pacearchaeota archaeon]
MKNKESYTPQEAAEMCIAYRLSCGGFDSPVHMDVIKKYEADVPQNVRGIVEKLNKLEHDDLQKALNEL